jgi:hypothetical protein
MVSEGFYDHAWLLLLVSLLSSGRFHASPQQACEDTQVVHGMSDASA